MNQFLKKSSKISQKSSRTTKKSNCPFPSRLPQLRVYIRIRSEPCWNLAFACRKLVDSWRRRGRGRNRSMDETEKRPAEAVWRSNSEDNMSVVGRRKQQHQMEKVRILVNSKPFQYWKCLNLCPFMHMILSEENCTYARAFVISNHKWDHGNSGITLCPWTLHSRLDVLKMWRYGSLGILLLILCLQIRMVFCITWPRWFPSFPPSYCRAA